MSNFYIQDFSGAAYNGFVAGQGISISELAPSSGFFGYDKVLLKHAVQPAVAGTYGVGTTVEFNIANIPFPIVLRVSDEIVTGPDGADYILLEADGTPFSANPSMGIPPQEWPFRSALDDTGNSWNDPMNGGMPAADYFTVLFTSLPVEYGMMTSLDGRMKISTEQIKHRLHTAGYATGGYKPSQPASESGQANYKPFPAEGTISALRGGAEQGTHAKTIPFVVEMDMVEAQIARLLDADLSVDFDSASPVWRAESDADNDGSNRKELKALGDMAVAQQLNVGGGAQVGLDANVTGNLIVGGDSLVDGDLQIGGASALHGAVTANANIDVQGTSDLHGAVTARQNLQVDGQLDAVNGVQTSGNLHVVGTSDFDSNVVMASAQVVAQLDVDGSADFDVTSFAVDATGKIDIKSTAADSGADKAIEIVAGTGGSIDIKGDAGISMTGDVAASDDVEITSTLLVGGASTFQGNVAAAADLEVQGTSGLTGAVTMGSTLEVDGDLQANADMQVQKELEVQGDASFLKDLDIAGKATLSGDLEVVGAVDIDATTMDIQAVGNIDIKSSAADGAVKALEIIASAGTLKLEGSAGVEFDGDVEFKDDVKIMDTLTLENGAGETAEPDFKLQYNDGSSITELIHFDGSSTAMVADFSGDVTIGGSLLVTDAIQVQGSEVNIIANVATAADNILEINKDNTGSHKSVGIILDGAPTEKDYFFGVNKASDRFVLTKELAADDWVQSSVSEDAKSQLDSAHADYSAKVVAAELHVGSFRSEGLMDIEGELHVGSVLDVTSAGGVAITGDLMVSEKGSFDGDLDVDGAADIKGGLEVEGIFKADNNAGTYSLVVDHSQAGLSGNDANGRLDLQTGVAQLKLVGDLDVQDALVQNAVVEGGFQAFGEVGLGAAGSEVRSYGEFTGELSAEFKSSLKVSDDGSGGYHLAIDSAAQTSGISISGRALAVGSDAFLTVADGKDALIKGDLGVKGDVVAGGDIWFGDYLKSRDEFLMQDSFVAGQSFDDKDANPHNVYGYALASHADDIQAVLNNSADALVDITVDGVAKKHINIMGILSGLIAGGSTLRYEYAIPTGAGIDKGATFNIGQVIHDETSSYKEKMKWYLNGQRLSDDDYTIVSGNAGKDISFNLRLEEDDVLIVDINDANPAA